MIIRMPWDSHLRWQYTDWLIENVGPKICWDDSEPPRIFGRGWNITVATYEEPYAQVELFDDCFLVEIEDDRLATLFSLTWL